MSNLPTTTAELLEWWPGNVPFKGRLVSDDGTCMCAQGQTLHLIGGYSVDDLRNIDQPKADAENARIWGISRAHSILMRNINDAQPGAPSIVITDPAQVLGDQAHIVLAFWRHLDRMTGKDWDVAWGARDAAGAAAGVAWDARGAAGAAAWDARGAAGAAAGVARDAADDAAWDARGAARDAADDAAGVAWGARDAAGAAAGVAWGAAGVAWDARGAAGAAAGATAEIQGAAVMRDRGQSFYFLPLFGFDSPEAVLIADKEHTA